MIREVERVVFAIVISVVALPSGALAGAAEALSKEEAASALRKAVGFFRQEVSVEGGYLWRYSADLRKREGEGKATPTAAWSQPPGTPTVGEAILSAYHRTGDAFYLDAATESAHALVKTQLRSGGWAYRVEFAEKDRMRYAYRVAPTNPDGRNVTTLDDDATQASLRFLMRVDKALAFKDEAIHEAALYALERLLDAQYPNGAWPQRFTAPPDAAKYPVKRASYPETWSRVHPKINYADYYTFNDNTISDTVRTMIEASRVYQDARYRAAAEKAGDFILFAQMPEPQPAWAQQYNADMHPAWARRFEPPAITGGESHGVLRTLLYLYRQTGNEEYLEPIPRALAYFKRSQLVDGRLARFYELETNTPLYFTKDYKLTYDNSDMPTHYACIIGNGMGAIENEYNALRNAEWTAPKTDTGPPAYAMTEKFANEARGIVDAMDDRGAWVEKGRLKYHGDDDPTTEIIDCRTFVRNVGALGRFVAASD